MNPKDQEDQRPDLKTELPLSEKDEQAITIEGARKLSKKHPIPDIQVEEDCEKSTLKK